MIRLDRALSGAALLFFTVAVLVRAATPPARSISSSRQFVVYGTDSQLRGAICDVAERCKQDALRLLGVRDEWQTPIVIQAQSLSTGLRLAQLHVNQTGHGLKFQLDLRLAGDVTGPEIERELLRAILLERMYRSQPDTPVGTAYVEPPDWLLDGTLSLAPERDSASIAQALATTAAGTALTLEEFLRQKRALLDSPSQALYRACSAALVLMLIESPEGRARLARFVVDLPQAPNDPLADLVAHFPGIHRDEIEKTWRTSILRLAGNERYRVLSYEESERQLAARLHVNVPGDKQTAVYALEEFPRFVRDRAAAPDLKRLTTDLLLLSARAHPIYRPVVGEYERIAALLLRGKAPKFPRRLAELRATREQLSRGMDAIGDYLNWFEATQASTSSGVFREYMRAAERVLEPEPRRRDRISVYLDALETQF